MLSLMKKKDQKDLLGVLVKVTVNYDDLALEFPFSYF